MPWHLPDDFRHFKNLTWAMPIIMGRRTYESMKGILPGRINIIVTSNKEWRVSDAFVVHDISSALEKAREADTKEIFVIGGGKIFNETMHLANRIYLTRVHVTLEGDTVYPQPEPEQWELVFSQDHPADARHAYSFTFETWERKHR